MKKNRLTKQILLALAVTIIVPVGPVGAAFTVINAGNDKILQATEDLDHYNNKDELSSFDKIHIETTESPGYKTWSGRLDMPNTDMEIVVKGETTSNNDGIHLTNWNPHIVVHNYTANIHGLYSDVINLSHDATSAYAIIEGDLNAIVDGFGHGIRANASWISNNEINTITIKGDANITLSVNGLTGANTYLPVLDESTIPTAVYAGADAQYDSTKPEEAYKNNITRGQGIVSLEGSTTIKLNGNRGYGIWAGKNGKVSVQNLDITADNQTIFPDGKFYGVVATDGNITYGSDDSPNAYGSFVTLNGNANIIKINIENGIAVYAAGTDINGRSSTIQSSENGIGYIDFLGNVEAEKGGLIDLHVTGSQSWLEGDVRAYGTENNNSAQVNLVVDHTLTGQGTLAAANGGIVNLELGANSRWDGRADDYRDAANPEWAEAHQENIENAFGDREISGSGKVNLTLGDHATWNVTGQSWVTELNGTNSYISLGDDETGSNALHIGKLTGTNTFVMNVRPTETGDMLYVKNGTSDMQHLVINNRDEVLENMDVGDAVRFATVQSAGGGFMDGEIQDNSSMSAGMFGSHTRINDAGVFNVDFDIEYHDYGETVDGDLGTDEKYNGGSFGENSKPGDSYVDENYGTEVDNTNGQALLTEEDAPTGSQNVYIVRRENSLENVSDAGKTVIAMSKVNYSNAVYMDRLNKRMGEARYIDGDDGLWVRMRHDRIGKDDAFRSRNTMFELGYDWHAKGQQDGEHRQGVAFDYMRGTADYQNVAGDGDVRRAGVWLYDTWLGDKGHYSDYVVKYGRLSNDFDIYALSKPGEKISGDYDNDVWSVSAEYGRKKDIGNDWYFEPQVQAQYAYVTSADYTTSQGTKVELDGIDSLIGRAGFRLGRDTSEGNTVYFKADILHEFLGDQSIRAMDATGTLSTTYENEGTWYDVGFGFSHKMGEDSYLFLDVEHSFGNDNEDTYQVNIGLNRAF